MVYRKWMSQKEVAAAMDITPQTLASWVNAEPELFPQPDVWINKGKRFGQRKRWLYENIKHLLPKE